ncbi:MAG TPA: hypothetical protein VFW79_13135 [Cellulomonas sp.]|uniref:hypothetical protein n=1 Tax=Cellulomonas sp. TaxID=40001 RepID=UPI002E2F8D71|nr:hypothetical protein [Cellulomonas sp.]HEX5333580.1 hypothetical protein [Cellulomonas sp.]
MIAVSGSGPWPGTDVLEAQNVVMGDLAETPDGITGIPFAVRLAARGPAADATGSTTALLLDLPVELGVHGWKLADRPGRDLARAQSLRREDLDALAVAAHGYVGPLLVPVTGPLTLAASLYLARGDRVVADRGAVAELSESLGAGIAQHLATVLRAVPGAEVTLLLDEPLLAQVVAGALPSFSGYSALRSVPAQVAAERLATVVRGARDAGAVRVVVHGGAAQLAIEPVVSSGADALALDVTRFDDHAWERLAEARERGTGLWFELPPPTTSGRSAPDIPAQADLVVAPWRRVGLTLADLAGVVLLARAPSAGATPDEARAELAGVVRAALVVAERAEG